MMFPLVLDLAADGVPVAVTCRVLGLSKQAFYRWKARPVTDRDWADAHLINVMDVDRSHQRRLPGRGITASQNRVRRLCTQQRL